MMKRLFLVLAMGCGAFGLASCGFQPVYSATASSEARSIEIDQIDGRAGHELRKALLNETANGLPGAPQGGTLTIALEEDIINTAFRNDGSSTRAIMRLRARYVIDLGDDAKSGTETSQVSINVPDPIFQDITNQNEAREAASQLLARQIVDRLILELTEAP
ncbi:MAG: LPS assembly lipoprotein LptE [Pseudomonadota bacterium]